MIHGISPDQLQSYVEARQQIDPEIRLIHSLAALLAQFEHIEERRVSIDPVALGIVHSTLEQSVLKVWGVLDEFMPLSAARRALDAVKSSGSPSE